jgi:hypothetical protein
VNSMQRLKGCRRGCACVVEAFTLTALRHEPAERWRGGALQPPTLIPALEGAVVRVKGIRKVAGGSSAAFRGRPRESALRV